MVIINIAPDVFRMKVVGGEFGFVVIGALSAWLIHTRKLMQVKVVYLTLSLIIIAIQSIGPACRCVRLSP